jgi:hypothetical protein
LHIGKAVPQCDRHPDRQANRGQSGERRLSG